MVEEIAITDKQNRRIHHNESAWIEIDRCRRKTGGGRGWGGGRRWVSYKDKEEERNEDEE